MKQIAILALVLAACGGDGSNVPESTTTTPTGPDSTIQPATSTTQTDGGSGNTQAPGGSGEYDRATFVMCPPLEENRDELAAIAGFEPDPDEAFDGFGSECVLRGTEAEYLSVELLPAFIESISFQAEAYDADATPVPELGTDAVYIDAPQSHIIFMVGNLIIDVGLEFATNMSQEAMTELALEVRTILTEANS